MKESAAILKKSMNQMSPKNNSRNVLEFLFKGNLKHSLLMSWLHNTYVSFSPKTHNTPLVNLHDTETDLKLPKKMSGNGQKCCSFQGAKLWNCLPDEYKKAASLKSFENSI